MAPHAVETEVRVEGVTDTTSVVIPDPVLNKLSTHSVFTIDDVLPHREQSAPMAPGVAAFASAEMFKSRPRVNKPNAKDWSHRISAESKSRDPSSLKGALKYLRPDMISLCGGLPSSDYFPFESIDVRLPAPPHFSESRTKHSGQTYTAGKHDIAEGKSVFDLSVALNYGQSTGPPQLVRFITEHNEIVHNPPYADWEIALSSGSTSALEVSLRMFLERGHYILTEEYSFSTAIETIKPLGNKLIGVKMDAYGMLPHDLDDILSTWDVSARGAPKPFLVYTVPTGQNPTASTQPLKRRQAIYAVAEKHDLFILEDEPYYFLQMEPYVSGKTHQVSDPFHPQTIPDFLSSLIPSYLSLDTSGRVLRLDSFSKIIAPGSRTGWVTGSKQIIERFIRHNECSSQNPSGFSEIILFKLLDEAWSHKGFLEWLMFIRAEYTRRRDIIVNACERFLPREVASWNPPMAGMFHWIKVDLRRHPSCTDVAQLDRAAFLQIEESIFLAAVTSGVLIARGSWFRAQRGSDSELFFRTTFAAASADRIEEAVRRLGEALRVEFGLKVPAATENGHAK